MSRPFACRPSLAALRPVFRAAAVRRLLAPPLFLLLLPAGSAAQTTLPDEFVGDWVEEGAECDAAARLVVKPDSLQLVNGDHAEAFGDLGIAHSYFGPDYAGIAMVVFPNHSGYAEYPFMVTFNADEREGIARVDIYDPPPGAVNPAYREVFETAKARSERFSLDHRFLTRCPVAG